MLLIYVEIEGISISFIKENMMWIITYLTYPGKAVLKLHNAINRMNLFFFNQWLREIPS